MKRILVTLALLLAVGVSALAQSGRKIYNKYSDMPEVNATYVSPAIFRIFRHLPEDMAISGDFNILPLLKTAKGLYSLNTDDAQVAEKLYADIKKYVTRGVYEILMETKENGSVSRIYTVGNKDTVTSLVFVNQEDGHASFLCLDGKMPRKQIEDLLEEAED